MSYGSGSLPLAVAHRGGAGLGPENTLAAFGLSTALGIRYLETDVRVTRDGQMLCFHDASLDRVTAASGPVGLCSLAELHGLRVDGREPLCTLEQALAAFPDARFMVDLKDRGALGPLVALLQNPSYAARVCVAGAWDGWLARLRAEVAGAHTALGWRSLTALIALSRAGARAPGWVRTAGFAHVPIRLGSVPILCHRLVDRAHDLGIRVVVWTVDEAGEMHRLLDAGVDGVITDRPDVLREVLIARGQWQPLRSVTPRPTPSLP